MVMPQVLKSAKMAPEVCVLDNEEAENFDPETWQILPIAEDQNCAIRTRHVIVHCQLFNFVLRNICVHNTFAQLLC